MKSVITTVISARMTSEVVAEEAVALFKPDLIVAPYLRRAIPASIWQRHVCLIVHPGIVGDRGPSALDWALQEGAAEWGVTVLQAEAEMDAGPVWATANFPLRAAKKSSIYRNDVTQAAVTAVLQAVERFASGDRSPTSLAAWPDARGSLRPLMKQAHRSIDWQRDDSATVLRKINAADGFPGVADSLFGIPCHIFDAWPEARLRGAPDAVPGDVVARRETALLRRTTDGAIWIGHAKRAGDFKLPATLAFAAESLALPDAPLDGWTRADHATWQDISWEESGSDENAVGFLHFEFYNGAMSTTQCRRLREALAWAKTRPVRVIVLQGGADFWSNGIHLNVIEAASLGDGSPADESWNNINAMNDLARRADHHRRAGGQCRRRRLLPGARRRPGLGARRRDAESALHEHGQPLRLGILDLPVAAPRRRRGCAHHHAQPPAADGAGVGRHRLQRRLPRRRRRCLPHRRGKARDGDCGGP